MFSGPVRLQDYLLINKTILVLDFFHGDSFQRKTPSKSTTVSRVLPGMPSHDQTSLNLLGSDFGWSGGMTTVN